MLIAIDLLKKKERSQCHNDDVTVTSFPAGEMFLMQQYSLTFYRREFHLIRGLEL